MRSKRRFIIRMLPLVLLVGLSGKFTGCEPEDLNLVTDCGECFDFQPDSARLIVYLTIDAENDSVPLVFYRGPFENGEVDWRDTATGETFYLTSEIDREYTVQATYRRDGKTILAYDSDEMFISDASDECGYPCYLVKGGIFDLRLRE